MIDLLLRVGTIITVDPDRRVLKDGAVAVDKGRIEAVGPAGDVSAEFAARRTIDAPHGVLLPGLVDAHSHAGHSLVRTMADDLDGWMDACERLYLHGATPEFWYAEARLTAAERLRFGTTTAMSMFGGAGDTVRADDPDHARAHFAGVEDVGLRTVLAVGPGVPPFPKRTTRFDRSGDGVEVESGLYDQLATVDELAGETRSPRSILATTFPTLDRREAQAAGVADAVEALLRLIRDRRLLLVQDGHTKDTVLGSAELGLLSERTLLSHATDLLPGSIDVLAESGTSIAHNPSAIFSQFGRCPVPELMEAGVTVGLGSDATAPDRSTDMFRHMFQLTRYHRADRNDPALFPPGTAIEMATIDAARALGLEDSIGSIEIGKEADRRRGGPARRWCADPARCSGRVGSGACRAAARLWARRARTATGSAGNVGRYAIPRGHVGPQREQDRRRAVAPRRPCVIVSWTGDRSQALAAASGFARYTTPPWRAIAVVQPMRAQSDHQLQMSPVVPEPRLIIRLIAKIIGMHTA